MFSSPLLPVDRTRLPPAVRRWVGRRLTGPPAGPVRHRWRAVVYQLDRLGDLVLAVSAIRTVLAAWGETACLLVVSSAAAPLAEREFPRTPRLVLPPTAPSLVRDMVPAWWRHRRRFRGVAADRVVCLSHHRDLYKEVVLSWVRAPVRLQLDRATYPHHAAGDWCTELMAHQQIVTEALGPAVGPEAITPRLTHVQPTESGVLLVCPVSEEKQRCLPDDVLIRSLQVWRRRNAAPIILSAAPAAAAHIAHLASVLRQQRIPNVTTATADTFDAFVARIAGAGAVLAIDSAPAHLATALDKRLVLLPGGGRHGLASPWRQSPRQVAIEHVVPCYGCGWRCTQTEIFCLTRVSPEDVAAALPNLP